jgi:hypothetical protein
MNKFAVILAHRNESNLHEMCESFALELRKSSPKVLRILPHIVLFQSEKDLTKAFDLLPVKGRLDGQVLLFQILGDYRGFALPVDRRADLVEFFQL